MGEVFPPSGVNPYGQRHGALDFGHTCSPQGRSPPETAPRTRTPLPRFPWQSFRHVIAPTLSADPDNIAPRTLLGRRLYRIPQALALLHGVHALAPGRGPHRLGNVSRRGFGKNAAPAASLLSRIPHYLLPGRPLGTAARTRPATPCRTRKAGAPKCARGRARTSSQRREPHSPRRESEGPHARAQSRRKRRSSPRRALGRHRTRPSEPARRLDFRRRSAP
jgi:hypothetical protein